MQPLVSVIVPCFNHQDYIADCLESLLAQTYPNIEVVVCDDASCDHSWEVIESYRERLEQRFANVILMKNPVNVGVTKNLNGMIQKSTGLYIKLASGDDFFTSECIEKLVDAICESDGVHLVFSNGYVVEENAKPSYFSKEQMYYLSPPSFTQDNLVEKLYQENFVFGLGALIKKELYETYGYYNENLKIDDWDIWLRFACNSVHFRYLEDKLVCYRRSNGSITSVNDDKKLEQRRITYFQAQMQILRLYQNHVSEQTRLDTIWKVMTDERKFALSHGLGNLIDVTEKEIRNFEGWKIYKFQKKIELVRQLISDKRHYRRS